MQSLRDLERGKEETKALLCYPIANILILTERLDETPSKIDAEPLHVKDKSTRMLVQSTEEECKP